MESIVFLIPALLFNILDDHFVRDVARGDAEVTDAPEMPAPIFFSDLREFLLDYSRASALEILDNL
ncbi:MAG: hypothetical protein A2174_02350 [Candidatus Portnoybacteria bacterium RBG_13_41_18]|uniref:Uncharacterized protein n=1 Tax=Candidatus Portnoybacteria bacterium RBG_13_41_18 TaxID=1801991 RepID=A0A1G2FAF1_9BACT|nr:MAG: hypothetical protein A2174_02350 [Candidatus Portnoybacteria bacterium RBG_13_41_18]